MTVQAQNLVQYYEGPIAIGTSLPINEFTFIDNSHVAVKLRGENTNWVYGTDYTVSGAATSTRNLTLLKVVPEGVVLAAYLEIPITQGLAPEEGGNFPAATQELSLDKLTYICQMLYSRVKRSVQVSIDSNFDGLLYDSATQAGKAIIINETGNGLTYSTDKINDIMTFVKSLFSQMETLNTNAATSATNAASSASAANISATNAASSASAANTSATNAANTLGEVTVAKDNAINSILTQQNLSTTAVVSEGSTQISLATAQAQAAAGSAAQAAIYAQQLEQFSVTYTAILDTTWVGTSAPYTQEVAIEGILATDNPLIGLIKSDVYATAVSQMAEYSKLYRGVALANKIVFYANEKTTISLPIQVKAIR